MLSHTNVCSSSMAVSTSGSCRPQERYLHVMPMFHLADFAARDLSGIDPALSLGK